MTPTESVNQVHDLAVMLSTVALYLVVASWLLVAWARKRRGS